MRKEKDSMGEILVPDDAYYGAQTQRASNNFPISNRRIPRTLIKSLGMIKKTAAIVNHKLNKLDDSVKDAIINACDEVIEGKHDDQFIVDIRYEKLKNREIIIEIKDDVNIWSHIQNKFKSV